jgi:hypothetical protein
MSDDVRALEDRHDALTRELDDLVRSNQNRRGVLLVEETTVHIKPVAVGLAIAALLGAAIALAIPHRKRPPLSENCMQVSGSHTP